MRAAGVATGHETEARDAILSAELVARAQAGERIALETLLQEQYALIRRMVLRLLGPGPDVEDLQQTIMLRVARGLSRFRGEASLSTWIAGICVNACRDYLRRNKTRAAIFNTEQHVDCIVGPTDRRDPERQAATRQALERTLRAVSGLSPSHRIVFLLKHVHGHSIDEISDMTGSAKSTTRMRLYYARKAFARAIAALPGEPPGDAREGVLRGDET